LNSFVLFTGYYLLLYYQLNQFSLFNQAIPDPYNVKVYFL